VALLETALEGVQPTLARRLREGVRGGSFGVSMVLIAEVAQWVLFGMAYVAVQEVAVAVVGLSRYLPRLRELCDRAVRRVRVREGRGRRELVRLHSPKG
jgi:hypothetical protein